MITSSSNRIFKVGRLHYLKVTVLTYFACDIQICNCICLYENVLDHDMSPTSGDGCYAKVQRRYVGIDIGPIYIAN